MNLDWAARRATLREAAWPIAQTAVGAGVAWAIARYALGHKQPFFAPIAATISLGVVAGRRGRQAVQLMTGVAVGIVIADLVVALIGTGAVQIAVVVALAMFAALLFSRSPLLVNQAGASAILVVALHRPHGGSQRLLDALAGGAVAILIGTVLFPADPRRLVADGARQTLQVLADGLAKAREALLHPEQVVSGWSLEIARGVHGALAGLAQAQQTAAGVVKLAPQRRRAREDVERFIAQAAQLDLLANAELSLVRRSGRLVAGGKQAPEWLGHTLESLEAALQALAADPAGEGAQAAARGHALDAAREARLHTESDPAVVALAQQARAMARDLLYVTGMGADQAREALA
ncbi:MAG: hypothetical protein QOC77_2629 [Thermoleophilaceae bacterium]|nr:hypothetical protein [Thermoleophilaceae bacterium]